jgi:CheY-like chemotaxis protein
VASDLATALQELEKERPVAVITDLELGSARDGWQLIEEIRNDPATRHVPVVILTRRLDPAGAKPHRKSLEAMILGSYREMPGLSLYLNQAGRLFGLREHTCRIVLEDLVGAGLLRRGADGQYVISGAAR